MLLKRFLVSLICSLILISCSKEESTQVIDNAPMATEEEVKEEVLVDAVNVYSQLSYYDDIDGKQSGVLMAGEVVSLTGNTGENKKGHKFYEIITKEGKRVWTWASYIFEKSKAGVVRPGIEATIFNKSNDNAITNTVLNPMTIVAVDSEFTNDTFSKIGWKPNDKGVQFNKYLLKDDISYNSSDIRVARIINKYNLTDNKDVKAELLVNAKGVSGLSSDFLTYIEFIEKDDFNPTVPDVSSISLKYSDYINVPEENEITPYKESVALESVDQKYELLNYILIDGKYDSDGKIELSLYNTSIYDLKTLPGEISINVNGEELFLGVIGDLSINSKDSYKLSMKILDTTFDKMSEYIISFNFVNGVKKSGKLFDMGGDK